MGKRGKRQIEQVAGGVAAVDRALTLLAAFAHGESILTLSQLAERSGLYKSTVLRLARSLEHGRLMSRLDDGRFRLGSEMLRLATIYRNGLLAREIVLPEMKALADRFQESVGFYVPEGTARRVCLYRINSNQTVAFNIRPGDSVKLPAGSAGRIIAAFSGWSGESYDVARRDMIYYSQGEAHAELASISSPVFGPQEEIIGALTVGGPKSRLDSTFYSRAATSILGAAARLTILAGGDPAALHAAIASREAAISDVGGMSSPLRED